MGGMTKTDCETFHNRNARFMPSEIIHNVLAKRRQATFVGTTARKLGNHQSSPSRQILCESIHKRSELARNLLYAIRNTVWQIVAPNAQFSVRL